MVQICYTYSAVNTMKHHINIIFLMSDKTSQNSLVYCVVVFFPPILNITSFAYENSVKAKGSKALPEDESNESKLCSS